MRRNAVRLVLVLAVLAPLLTTQGSVAVAGHAQSSPDPSKVDYTPIGYYGPSDEAGTPSGESATIPNPGAGPPSLNNPNPSGKWVAYDTNVWESLALPSRHPGDNCNSLPAAEQASCKAGDLDPDDDGPQGYQGPGGTSLVHGICPPSAGFVAGECFNSQLEWLDYYERSMKEMLADFGVVVHRYPFHSPGRSDGGTGRGGYLDAAGGQAYNISATVPGSDHPEETVLVSGHYDFTDSGPAAAWDSAEGHTEVMRMAYIMADYWRKTGTRPSATVKFIPWDSEESGTFGSIDYVQNNIPPGEEGKVRGYFNVDPCAGAYPAYKNGNPAVRVPQVMQLANPEAFSGATRARMEAFNARAETIVDDVFGYLDDTITIAPGVEEPIFVSDAEAAAGHDGKNSVSDSQRDEIVTAVGGLAIFSSDYANFEEAGIPIFNFFPDYFGLHADGTPGHNDGLSILHTPNDNLTSINRLTSTDASGLFASEGWAKGMEMCAQVEAWYMLQPEMGGAQTATDEAVAYYEALPNEALQNQLVKFDASGSYQYADAASRALADGSSLTYTWDFGDGTSGTGKVVQHAYDRIGRYTTKLTVTGAGGVTDTMTIPVEVVGSNFAGPLLDPIDAEDAADGDFPLTWEFSATREDFDHFSVEEASDFRTFVSDDAEGSINNRWTVQAPSSANVEPWQASDSGTVKFRGNQSHSGSRSFWTGVTPDKHNPPPLSATSILTLKEPIAVPLEGETEVSFWSLFQNEGDDQGRVEAAPVDDAGNVGEWQAVDVTQAVFTALGDPHDPAVCSTLNPEETLAQGFGHRRASLGRFKGKQVLVRFVYFLGAENRALSHPCGWYIDDIRVHSGTYQEIGTTTGQTFQVSGRRNGTYGYRVTGVYRDGVKTAPSNAESARVTQARPDLRVGAITTSSNRAREGEKVTITATVENGGRENAGASKTEFLLDGSTVLGLVDTAPIPAGGSTKVSVQWDTRSTKGEHKIKVSADKAGAVAESSELNNSATLTVTVQGNKVKNGSFEQSNEAGSAPANWTSSDTGAGTTAWSEGGSEGARSASIEGNGGNAAFSGSPSWTSDPISVNGGETLSLVVSVKADGVSSGPSASLAYLGPAGDVLDTVTVVAAPLMTFGFEKLENTVTVPAGVTQVRVTLSAFAPFDTSTSGSVSFDEVGLFGS